jgi:hypothetical protein
MTTVGDLIDLCNVRPKVSSGSAVTLGTKSLIGSTQIVVVLSEVCSSILSAVYCILGNCYYLI